MASHPSFEKFQEELGRLVGIFEKNLAHYKKPGYDEASLRQEFLNPLFAALGWDVENKAGHIPSKREVEVESRTHIGGRQKRADYLFRTEGVKRFVCEAKKPAVSLEAKEAFQAKRYAYNMSLPLAVLTDFEEMKIYIVGGKARIGDGDLGLWKTWHFRQFPLVAEEIWNLISRDRVAAGSIDALLDSLPKRPAGGKGKAKQQWLINPDRTRALATDFLEDLEKARRDLASDILRHNDRAETLDGTRLNEAVQCILDRILFIRICEDRDIDTGPRLQTIVEKWRRNWDRKDGARHTQDSLRLREDSSFDMDDGGGGGGRSKLPRESLWRAVVAHFRALDRRPPSHVPFFNGNLFKRHFSEEILLGDTWLAEFIAELSDDETPYLFNYISVEILGSVYERFLGKVVRPHGKGITVEEKPEVRKAGGVYYTPRYIVDYIVEQTVGKLVENTAPEKTLALRILDPACGSGSFLICAFERMCEHWQQWLTKNREQRKKKWCWVDADTGDVHLTVDLKRRILIQNIYGVDLDAAAVEVTQLSLYLKMLENENRNTMQRERELFADADAVLPPLQDNIKCGNSLIASDFSMMPEDLLRVNAFDWQTGFREIMKAGGFDAVIGNPPYRMLQPHNTEADELEYLKANYVAAEFKIELFHLFLQRGISLVKKDGGLHGHIVPTTLLNNVYAESLRRWLMDRCAIQRISVAQGRVFHEADVHTSVLIFRAEQDAKVRAENPVLTNADLSEEFGAAPSSFSRTKQKRFSALPGATWNILLNEENAPLIERLIRECQPLEEVGTINRGLVTGDRDKYFSPEKKTAAYIPIITGSDVHRYFTKPASEFVRFERPDKAGGCWDAVVHLAPHKVLIRQIGVEPTASIITEPIAVTANIFTLRASSVAEEKYLLAIINSKLTAYFWRTMFADFKASFPQVTIFSLSQVPVRRLEFKVKADRARHDKLVEQVDKMLALVPKLRSAKHEKERGVLQNAVDSADRKIDDIVYELYALTPEEIALVEGTAK